MKELWKHSLIRCGKTKIRYSTSLSGVVAIPVARLGTRVKIPRTSVRPRNPENKKASRPTRPCDGPRMNPSVDVGNPPRPFRHLRMAERCSPDPSSSRVPVHSALVQKSVTAITNPAGRLSLWMLGKSRALGKWKTAKSWQVACNQSNHQFTNGLARRCGRRKLGHLSNPRNVYRQDRRERSGECKSRAIASAWGPRKDLILLVVYASILSTQTPDQRRSRW